jgi:hypothetical protein
MAYIKMYSTLLPVLLLTSPALPAAGRDCNTAATEPTPIKSVTCIKTRVNVAKVSATMEKKALAEGNWGGQQVRLSVTESGADVDFACAHGTVDQRIELDDEGRFEARGTYEYEGGGPVKRVTTTDEDLTTQSSTTDDNVHSARYTGRVIAERMTLTVTLTKTGRSIGTFSLIQGATPRMHKCN